MLGGFNWDHSLGINWAWVPLIRSTNLYGLEGPVTEIYNFDSGWYFFKLQTYQPKQALTILIVGLSESNCLVHQLDQFPLC